VDRIRIEDELTVDLDTINTSGIDAFVAVLGGVFEHSPWIARAAYAGCPFDSVAALHAAMVSVVTNCGTERQLALLRAHPELARPATLTEASAAEQGGMGLNRLDADEAALFDARNVAYRAKFGFPFIIAVRGQRDRAAILAALLSRLEHSPGEEMEAALAEVAKIARFRLDDLLGAGPDGR
jgi:2-oxo-4-hydroxy-4-carboxy-5-ureidoimidazoline decarboxylase